MTKEKCMEIIRKRLGEVEKELKKRTGGEDDWSWYDGLSKGMKSALELVGMIDNEQNK